MKAVAENNKQLSPQDGSELIKNQFIELNNYLIKQNKELIVKSNT